MKNVEGIFNLEDYDKKIVGLTDPALKEGLSSPLIVKKFGSGPTFPLDSFIMDNLKVGKSPYGVLLKYKKDKCSNFFSNCPLSRIKIQIRRGDSTFGKVKSDPLQVLR